MKVKSNSQIVKSVNTQQYIKHQVPSFLPRPFTNQLLIENKKYGNAVV